MDQLPAYLASLFRLAAMTAAGVLLSSGYITETQADQVGGTLLIVLTVLWSMHAKRKAAKVLRDAIAAPAGRATP